jgi:hypothetical protein
MTDNTLDYAFADDVVTDQPLVPPRSFWRNVLKYILKRTALLAVTWSQPFT